MKKVFLRHVAYPLYFGQKQLRGRSSSNWLTLLDSMQERERLSVVELRAYQLERLKKLLTHAGEHVPYYRDLFRQHGFNPQQVQDPGELLVLPPLTKDIIAREGKRLLSDDAAGRGVFKNNSSGSTGTPALFYQDQSYRDYQRVATWMSDMAAGWQLGDEVARLWGAPRDIENHFKGRTDQAVNWLLNQRFYSTLQMSDMTMQRYHADLSRRRPDVIVAYSSSAYLLALYLEAHGLQPRYPRKSIITSAEVLHPYMRETIERVFDRPVFDRYGSRDAGLIGYECEQHNGLHVNMQNMVLECADQGQAGEPGLARITLLENYAMPFIRYEIGDLLVMSDRTCTCGRSAPLIDRVVGRTQDFLTLRSGKKFVGEFITSKILNADGIQNFQFVQETLDQFVLYIVKGANFDEDFVRTVHRKILDAFGEGCQVETRYVEHIPPTAAGKHRTVISKVPVQFDPGMETSHD